MSCRFLWFCSGYYRYDHGYTPVFQGAETFAGPVVHPQHWPADLDWTDRRVVVIGSGATAVTLVPALAERAASVTMLQRSPSYVAMLPSIDRTAARLLRRLPQRWATQLVRARSIVLGMIFYGYSRRRPAGMRALLRRAAADRLPAGFDVDTHFNPRYDPWDQRLCVAADGDLFAALRSGRAEMVTDRIRRFVPDGIELTSGRVLPADVIITATGLEVITFGGATLSVDGRPVEIADTVAYRAMMLSGVPNLAMTIGYSNASWTLKADLVAHHVIRVLRRLRRRGYASVTPRTPVVGDHDLPSVIGLQSGYVKRARGSLPRQGFRSPWRIHENYLRDLVSFRFGRLTPGLRFERSPAAGRSRS